jgi:hypothetical protein
VPNIISDESGVGETEPPRLTGLEGAHDRVLGGGGVLPGVGVLRLITTADIAAAETEAKMDPGVPNRQALTASGAMRLHLLDHGDVLARW